MESALQIPTGDYTVTAVIDNQKHNGSRVTGAIYREGLSERAASQGLHVGSGYLEMTRYTQALRL